MITRLLLMIVSVAVVASTPCHAADRQPVYLDPAQPLEDRVTDLISRMTVPEKISQMSTNAPAIERLKVPALNGWNQGLHGIVWTEPTTMFPAPINMAATWDMQLVHDIASAIGDEGRAINNLWSATPGRVEDLGPIGQSVTITPDGKRLRHNGLLYRAPVINLVRDPRWGRAWETFGEDPWLSARMTVAFVRGMQGENPRYLKLGTTLKHYAVYDDERDRFGADVTVSERTLREYFLPQFRAGVIEAGATSVMSVYNSINGSPGAVNRMLLKDILRDEWKFDGIVVPDTFAIPMLVKNYGFPSLEKAAAEAVKASTDLDDGAFASALPKAYAEGFVNEADIDQALRRTLRTRFRLGEFDPAEMVPYRKIPASVIASPEHLQLALVAARKSIVLLRNVNGALPLDKGKLHTVGVIGPFADIPGGESIYSGRASGFVTNVAAIRSKLGPDAKVLYARGSGILEGDDAAFAEAQQVARQSDVVLVFAGIGPTVEAEDRDRTDLSLPAAQRELISRVQAINPNVILILNNGGPVSLDTPEYATGMGSTPLVPVAVVDAFRAGEVGATAVADVLFGDYNPAGRLPYTVYSRVNDLIPWRDYEISHGATYMYFRGAKSWPFGHGLSYTSFAYSGLEYARSRDGGDLIFKVDVQNTGTRHGDEVVQLYLRDAEPGAARPLAKLVGFQRIHIAPGKKKTIAFPVSRQQLAHWDETRHAWVVDGGDLEVMAGASSEDIRQRIRFSALPGGDLGQQPQKPGN